MYYWFSILEEKEAIGNVLKETFNLPSIKEYASKF